MVRNLKIFKNSSGVLGIIKYRSLQYTGETKIAYRLLVGNPLQRNQLEDQEDDKKKNFRLCGWEPRPTSMKTEQAINSLYPDAAADGG
jgi:hypothetical protein